MIHAPPLRDKRAGSWDFDLVEKRLTLIRNLVLPLAVAESNYSNSPFALPPSAPPSRRFRFRRHPSAITTSLQNPTIPLPPSPPPSPSRCFDSADPSATRTSRGREIRGNRNGPRRSGERPERRCRWCVTVSFSSFVFCFLPSIISGNDGVPALVASTTYCRVGILSAGVSAVVRRKTGREMRD